MGSRFEIAAVPQDAAHARAAIAVAYDEIDRIEALISSWQNGRTVRQVSPPSSSPRSCSASCGARSKYRNSPTVRSTSRSRQSGSCGT
jgi:hypothetical protein